MFDHLKERFDLEDNLVNWLTENEEFGELFKDYELLYAQSIKYPRKIRAIYLLPGPIV